MLFMNASDIVEAVARHRSHPILGRATRLLAAVAADAEFYSDGWHSWPKPCRACSRLITLIQSPNTATETGLSKAIAPIRSFYTKAQAGKFGATYYPQFPPVI